MPEIIAIASGKGGVGKSNISVNLAIRLASQGKKVCLFDADLGLANINILLGLTPYYSLEEVITGEKTLKEIILKNEHGIDIIPGSTGVEALANLDDTRLNKLVKPLSELEDYDYFFFDTSAGISKHVIAFCMASTDIILTIIPEPTSFTDSYSLLKVLHRNGFKNKVCVVINRCKNKQIAEKIFYKFKETVNKYLHIELHYLGAVVEDVRVAAAITAQRPFLDMFPEAPSSACVHGLANQLNRLTQGDGGITMETFWTTFSRRLKDSISVGRSAKKKVEKNIVAKVEPKKESPAPSITDDSELGEFAGLILSAINTIVKNTADISQELGELRKAIAKNNDNIPQKEQEQVEEEKTSEDDPNAITLDFEKFLIKRKSGNNKAEKGT